jgi:DNA-binding NtrC family response regulator
MPLRRILVVDDDPLSLQATCQHLLDHEICNVTPYVNPVLAFRSIVKDGCPRSILISQSMKSMDGNKLAYEICCLYEEARVILIADAPQSLPEYLTHVRLVVRGTSTFAEDLLFAFGR